MDTSDFQQQCQDYRRIEKALQFAAENYRQHPTLAELAATVHLSEHHFQRIFRRWAGVSPKQFLQYLTVQHARQCLSSDMTVTDAAYDTGLTAPSRLYELFIRLEALTPAEYKSGGVGLVVNFGFHDTPFGQCLIGTTQRGITHLSFLSNTGLAETESNKSQLTKEIKCQSQQIMQSRIPRAQYVRDDDATAESVQHVFTNARSDRTQALLVGGSAFQLKVWEALLRTRPCSLMSYQQLAQAIDNPNAVRAVGTAVGQNPIAYLIPCHRVIRSNGMLGDYRWGVGRKLAVQGWEYQPVHENQQPDSAR